MKPILLISHPNLYPLNQENISPTGQSTQQALTDFGFLPIFFHVLNHFQHTKWQGFFQLKMSIRLGNLEEFFINFSAPSSAVWGKRYYLVNGGTSGKWDKEGNSISISKYYTTTYLSLLILLRHIL